MFITAEIISIIMKWACEKLDMYADNSQIQNKKNV